MNTALDNALREKGIDTEQARVKFAHSLGFSERTLRRWLSEEIARPQPRTRLAVARRLGCKPEDLWPNGRS